MHESTREVYIGPDLTRKERLAGKDLRDELKARRARGEESIFIRRNEIVTAPPLLVAPPLLAAPQTAVPVAQAAAPQVAAPVAQAAAPQAAAPVAQAAVPAPKKLSTNCKNVRKTHTAQFTQEINIGSTAPKPNLICLYCNARSLYYKLNELEAMIEDLKPDLIFITETWLHPDIKNAEVMLSGFSEPIRKDRTGRRGGGCIMYAKQGLTLREEIIVGSEDT